MGARKGNIEALQKARAAGATKTRRDKKVLSRLNVDRMGVIAGADKVKRCVTKLANEQIVAFISTLINESIAHMQHACVTKGEKVQKHTRRVEKRDIIPSLRRRGVVIYGSV